MRLADGIYLERAGIVFLIFLGLCLRLAADTHYVSPEGTNGWPFTNWSAAAVTITAAVDAAENGDTVLVTNGTYAVNAAISITKALTLISMNGTGATTIAGIYPDNSNRCLTMNNTGLVVSGFAMTNGWLHGSGGGVYMYSGVLTNCLIKNCRSGGSGGGVYLTTGEVRNCVIYGNYQTNTDYYKGGGGIFAAAGRIYDSLIINNTSAFQGGGIMISGSSYPIIISNCTVAGNLASRSGEAGGGGVAIVKSYAWVTVIDSVISNNISTNSSAGGVYCYGYIRLDHCDIVNNISGSGGGGIMREYDYDANLHGSIIVTNCLVANNRAYQGGGVYVRSSFTSSKMTLVDSRFFFNSATNDASGGAIIAGVFMEIDRCIIMSNSAWHGAGIFIDSTATNFVMKNCLVAKNVSTYVNGYAGGLRIEAGATGSISDCTIAGNSAKYGGGIEFRSGAYGITVSNCVIWGNTNTPGGSSLNIYGTTVSNYFYWSCSPGLDPARGCITNDPLFVDTNTANWRLITRSPAVNRGSNENWMTNGVDLDRRMRIRHGRVDMGAYEAIYSGFVFSAY